MYVILDKDSTAFYNNNKVYVSKPGSVSPFTFGARHFRTVENAQKYIEKLNKRNVKVYGHVSNYEIVEDK